MPPLAVHRLDLGYDGGARPQPRAVDFVADFPDIDNRSERRHVAVRPGLDGADAGELLHVIGIDQLAHDVGCAAKLLNRTFVVRGGGPLVEHDADRRRLYQLAQRLDLGADAGYIVESNPIERRRDCATGDRLPVGGSDAGEQCGCQQQCAGNAWHGVIPSALS